MPIAEKYKSANMIPRLLPSHWWLGHIPFARVMIEALRPATIVELGTYSGASFFSFCQTVHELGLGATCYGIDMWEGDVHMGEFGDSLYKKVLEYKDNNYPDAIFIRKFFNEAVHDFEDGSVDLLHIDGTHTYEAVRSDYKAWLPKVSPRGVIMFHDTNVTLDNIGPGAEGFGVKKLFDEIKQEYPHTEFKHSYGLGVVAVGGAVPEDALELIGLSKQAEYQKYFSLLGERLVKLYERQELLSFNPVRIWEILKQKLRKIKILRKIYRALRGKSSGR